jgi:GT2 family glycosyltransferase
MKTIGVVIPVGGQHGKYVRDALDSLAAGTVLPDAVVVVADHTPIPTLTDYPEVMVLQVPEGRKGASAARNVGLHAVETDAVFFLDADDRVLPNALRLMRAALDVGAEFIHGAFRILTRAGKWSEPMTYDSVPTLRAKVERRNGDKPDVGASVCVLRQRALEIGGFDERMTYGEDNDFAIRYVLPSRIRWFQSAAAFIEARSETSTRWEDPPTTITDDRPYVDRLTSGYYLRLLEADEALHAEAV